MQLGSRILHNNCVGVESMHSAREIDAKSQEANSCWDDLKLIT